MKNYGISVLQLISILCKQFDTRLRMTSTDPFLRCGDSILINGKGNVKCPGVDFLMTLIPPPALPLLMGANLTDKGCLPLMNPLAQTTLPHKFDLVPPGAFSGCNATNSPNATIKVDSDNGWASLNMISTASLQEMVVSIDEHPMWVYEIDGRYIEPQLVDALSPAPSSPLYR